MDERAKRNLTQPDVWLRLLFVLLFAALYSLAEIVLAAVVIVQFVIILASGRRNPRLLRLGHGLSTYAYQVWMFMSFNTDVKPYPFAEWPSQPGADDDGSSPVELPPSPDTGPRNP
jgi:hypothetical protein